MFIFISPCSPEVKLDFVTKLSHIHGNIMRTNQVTGNIIVSTYHPRKHVLTIAYCMTGRAIQGSSRVAVLAQPQGGTIHNLRTEYFPVLTAL